jgi:hypothetical protein
MRRHFAFAVLLGVAATAASFHVDVARAASPVHFSLTKPVAFTDTDSCAFPIEVNLEATLVGTVFLDSQGNIQSVIVEQNVVGTDTANGVTLRDATHYADFFDPLGDVKEVGLDFHVQNGGLILRDAGYLTINPDGSVAFVRGPHPFPTGDIAPFCAAFA